MIPPKLDGDGVKVYDRSEVLPMEGFICHSQDKHMVLALARRGCLSQARRARTGRPNRVKADRAPC